MDFVIIGNPWHFGGDNPTSKHQIALELAAQNHRVLWINAAGMRVPSLGSGADRKRIIERLLLACRGLDRVMENIWVLSPLVLPFPRSRLARCLNEWIYRLTAWRGICRLRLSRPVLISFFLLVPEMIRQWADTSIYYCVDKWDAFGRYDSVTMAEMNRRSCTAADIVLASSSVIFNEIKIYNSRTYLVPHGVKYEHFHKVLESETVTARSGKKPVDLPEGKIIGFFGLLDERVDKDLVVRVAGECSGSKVVLLGKADSDVSWMHKEPNIVWLGAKSFDVLPEYVAGFTVGIIPYAVNAQTMAINPVKLLEMMAAGCPVVSTDLPEVKKYGSAGAWEQRSNGVAIGRDQAEFVRLVKERLEKPLTPDEQRVLSMSVSGETWSVRVKQILELIG